MGESQLLPAENQLSVIKLTQVVLYTWHINAIPNVNVRSKHIYEFANALPCPNTVNLNLPPKNWIWSGNSWCRTINCLVRSVVAL